MKGITAKGLLLASLPLLLTPVLSYLFTPVVIPITATTVAGRRRRKRYAHTNLTTDASSDSWTGLVNGTSKNGHRVPIHDQLPQWPPLPAHIPEQKLAEAKVKEKESISQ